VGISNFKLPAMLLVSKICNAPCIGGPSSTHPLTFEAQVLYRPPVNSHKGDAWGAAYVSIGILRRLKCLNHGWAQVGCVGGSKIILRVVECEDLPRDDCVFLNPLLAYNLGVMGGSVVELVPRSQGGCAKRVTLQRVRSPGSSGHAEYGPALRDFFSVPRVLRKLDIVAIALPIDMSQSDSEDEVVKEHDFDDSGGLLKRPCKLVFFQVSELIPVEEADDGVAGLLVDGIGGETTLAQAGAVNCKVPNPDSILRYILDNDPATTSPASASQKEISNLIGTAASSTFKGHFALLLSGAKCTGKRYFVRQAALAAGFHIHEVSLTPLRGLPEERAAKKLEEIMQEANQMAPCVLLLRHLHALAPVSNGAEAPPDPEQVVHQLRRYRNDKVVLVASTQNIDEVPSVVRGCFTHELNLSPPDKEERKHILESLVRDRITLDPSLSLEELALKTAGKTIAELRALFSNAACMLIEEESQCSEMEAAWQSIQMVLSKEVVEKALLSLPSASVMDIAAPKIPSVYWNDVGGLGHAKEEILDMVQLPIKHPELFASGVRQRSGILLYGPPGTGKTLLAKAVATECSLNFISVKGPELLDMYIGESERKVRQVFETARNAKPCVLFFDELDSLAPQRGRGSDSGGVMDRVVSQLLTEIDGMQGNTDVFVIGATNRPDLLDQSLLRPGRFDRLIYLGISRDRNAQFKILSALSRKYIHDEDVDLMVLLNECPFNFTGADFYAIASGSMANALQRRVKEIQDFIAEQPDTQLTARKYLATLSEDELQVTVKMCDYRKALSTTVSSVSEDEIKHYESLRQKFSAGGE